MNILLAGRQRGKSTIAIREADRNGIPLVCPSESAKDSLLKTSKEMGCEIEIITASECARRGNKYGSVVVDDANLVLEQLLKARVSFATLDK